MLSWLIKIVAACWRPVQRYARMNRDDSDYDDELLWYKDLVQHTSGDLCIAVVQANSTLEDQSQVESGPSGTFVGIYDGHGGPEAARFVCDHLFMHVREFAREQGGMSEDVLRRAFQTTEEEFLSFATKSLTTRPHLATVGSCCLIGVIWGEILYVANLGDSRAVMGSLNRVGGNITALQLTSDHNANLQEVRQELRDLHPDDAHIVSLKHGVWRVKGIIQISRSIGDIYLKKPEVSRDILYARFQLSEPLKRPVLTAEPSVRVQILRPQDRFLIFASDGLWEHLSSQEAVELVHNHPRAGIAKRLIRCALQEAARKREMRYSDVKKIGRGIRRHFHDDITVIVVFVDHELLGKHSGIPPVSLRGCVDCVTAPSCLFSVDGTDVGCSDIV